MFLLRPRQLCKYCDQRICLSVCPLVYFKTTRPNFIIYFLCMFPAAAAQSCDMQQSDKLNVITQQSERARIRDDAYASSSSPDGGIGGEVCRLRLHLVPPVNFPRDLWQWTEKINVNHRTKYLPQRLSISKVTVQTETQSHTIGLYCSILSQKAVADWRIRPIYRTFLSRVSMPKQVLLWRSDVLRSWS